jgi:hypothetical protein
VPISVVEIYEDVVKDTANAQENGLLSYAMFNRLSRRAELRLIDWLTGSVGNERIPIPYLSQKNKDWLAPFIARYSTQVKGGRITRPSDYYQYENFYRLGIAAEVACDEEPKKSECNTPIEILDGQEYYERCRTYISGLKPSLNKPIAKAIGKEFEVMPADMGSVALEYIRYPKFGTITSKIDPDYNVEVPDTVQDYEWEENSRELLIWFICDAYSNHTREQSLKQFNQASNPKE